MPGELAEDPGGRQDLEACEHRGGGREAGLQVDRVAEEEAEVALGARIVGGQDARGQGDEREGKQRDGQPPVGALPR